MPEASYMDIMKGMLNAPTSQAAQGADPSKADHGKFNVAKTPETEAEGQIIEKSHGEYMVEAFPDSVKRKEVSDLMHAELDRMKVGTGDITSLLQSTLSKRNELLQFTDTPFSDFMALYEGTREYLSDWLLREKHKTFSGLASRVNPEADITALNPVAPTWHQNVNVLQFVGDPAEASFIADAQADQQDNADLMQQIIDPVLESIRQRWEYDALLGQRQVNPTPPNVTQMGGVIEATQTLTYDMGPSPTSVTETKLEEYNKALGMVKSMSSQKAIFTTYETVGDIRDIMIERFSGNNPKSFMDANSVLATKMKTMGLNADGIYQPVAGPPIPVIQCDKLVNTMLMMILDPKLMPKWVYFKLLGTIGPWLFTDYKKLSKIFNTKFVMDGRSMDRGPEKGRAVITNVK